MLTKKKKAFSFRTGSWVTCLQKVELFCFWDTSLFKSYSGPVPREHAPGGGKKTDPVSTPQHPIWSSKLTRSCSLSAEPEHFQV